jgi:hypothetical protein
MHVFDFKELIQRGDPNQTDVYTRQEKVGSTPFDFMGLPVEIRFIVYQLLPQPTIFRLIPVNRAIRAEAKEVLLSQKHQWFFDNIPQRKICHLAASFVTQVVLNTYYLDIAPIQGLSDMDRFLTQKEWNRIELLFPSLQRVMLRFSPKASLVFDTRFWAFFGGITKAMKIDVWLLKAENYVPKYFLLDCDNRQLLKANDRQMSHQNPHSRLSIAVEQYVFLPSKPR